MNPVDGAAGAITDHRCAVPGDLHAVSEATPAGADAVADLLADAFAGYPWTDWIVPAEDRRRRLRRLHRLGLDLAMPHGSVHLVSCPAAADRPVGAVAIIRPDRPVPDVVWSRYLQAQADVLGERGGAARAAEAALADVRPHGPAVVVATLAVARDHRRRGLARRLLGPALELADRLDVQACLETSTTDNVHLYRSVGFEVAARRTVPDGGPEVWTMRRPSRSERRRLDPGAGRSPEGDVRQLRP